MQQQYLHVLPKCECLPDSPLDRLKIIVFFIEVIRLKACLCKTPGSKFAHIFVCYLKINYFPCGNITQWYSKVEA